jgi:uncharacterized glyoxalase superfamily protein PhnB
MSVPAPTVWPCLTYTDAKAAIRFLVDAFGFEERLVVPGEGEDDREVAHAELVWPTGGALMLGSASPTASAHSRIPAGTGAVYVVCDDPDAVLARAVAGGAEIIAPITEASYGNRSFSARDPEGNLWVFGTYRGSPRS